MGVTSLWLTRPTELAQSKARAFYLVKFREALLPVNAHEPEPQDLSDVMAELSHEC